LRRRKEGDTEIASAPKVLETGKGSDKSAKIDALWNEMKNAPISTTSVPSSNSTPPEKKVDVTQEYQFAGETVKYLISL
jgi:hypothetical protein